MNQKKDFKASYAEKLKSPKWQKVRLQILERDNWTCTLCGDTETSLHVHHQEYKGEPWDCPVDKLKTVCEDCHQATHYLSDCVIIKCLKMLNRHKDKLCVSAYDSDSVHLIARNLKGGEFDLLVTIRYGTLNIINESIPTI